MSETEANKLREILGEAQLLALTKIGLPGGGRPHHRQATRSVPID